MAFTTPLGFLPPSIPVVNHYSSRVHSHIPQVFPNYTDPRGPRSFPGGLFSSGFHSVADLTTMLLSPLLVIFPSRCCLKLCKNWPSTPHYNHNVLYIFFDRPFLDRGQGCIFFSSNFCLLTSSTFFQHVRSLSTFRNRTLRSIRLYFTLIPYCIILLYFHPYV